MNKIFFFIKKYTFQVFIAFHIVRLFDEILFAVELDCFNCIEFGRERNYEN